MAQQSYEEIFRQWLGNSRGLMLKITRSFAEGHEDQEDLLQEILMQLWRSVPSFAERSEASTWVYRVAFNTAIAWKRGISRHRHVLSLMENDVSDKGQASTSIEDRDALDRLYAAIRSLPKVERSLVLLYLDSRSYREISEILGLSEVNVGVRLTRARKTLADLMKDRP